MFLEGGGGIGGEGRAHLAGRESEIGDVGELRRACLLGGVTRCDSGKGRGWCR